MPVLTERTINTRKAFDGRHLHLEVLDVETSDGRTSTREIIRHPGAAVVLARFPDGSFLFVRQYRKAVETALIEAVAGGLEPGETPEECARREVAEESGYAVASIQYLGPIICCPGYSSEVLHGFLADLDPAAGAQSPDEDENIETFRLLETEVESCIAKGSILDGKTLAMWLLYRLSALPADKANKKQAVPGSEPVRTADFPLSGRINRRIARSEL